MTIKKVFYCQHMPPDVRKKLFECRDTQNDIYIGWHIKPTTDYELAVNRAVNMIDEG
jgi:hypothetical protein